jgi:hypothetical protein
VIEPPSGKNLTMSPAAAYQALQRRRHLRGARELPGEAFDLLVEVVQRSRKVSAHRPLDEAPELPPGPDVQGFRAGLDRSEWEALALGSADSVEVICVRV